MTTLKTTLINWAILAIIGMALAYIVAGTI